LEFEELMLSYLCGKAECSKPKNRGKSVVVIGIFIASGVAMAAWINFGFSFYQHNSICWRLPLSIPLIFCTVIAFSAVLFPESPRWLVQNGRYDEAKAVISILEDVSLDSEHIVIEIDSIREACSNHASHERGFLDLFKIDRQRMLYRTALAVLINFCAQMTGENISAF
jgi:MFS family permease